MSRRMHPTSCEMADIAEAAGHRIAGAPELVAELVAALRALSDRIDVRSEMVYRYGCDIATSEGSYIDVSFLEDLEELNEGVRAVLAKIEERGA